MKVFISWSGPSARKIAVALHRLINTVIQGAKPWMSDKEISAGDRGEIVIAGGLEDAYFGIICITSENQRSPWLNFEAGAISKDVGRAKVIPYLYGIKRIDLIEGPLKQFQAKHFDSENFSETLEMLMAINNSLSEPLSRDILEEAFNGPWITFRDSMINLEILPQKEVIRVASIEERLNDLAEAINRNGEADEHQLNLIDKRLKHLTFILDDQSLFKDKDKIFNNILRLSNMRIRAFLKPATIRINEDERLLTLEYDLRSKFHYNQAIKLKTQITDILDIVTMGTYRLSITNLSDIKDN